MYWSFFLTHNSRGLYNGTYLNQYTQNIGGITNEKEKFCLQGNVLLLLLYNL
jgi:hypothetical protein